jgi:hypothetical protein
VVTEIMAAERRLICMVLARGPGREARDVREPRRPGAPPAADRAAQERAVLDAVERHRGKLEVLADGALRVTLSNADAATDLAARAARCALTLHAVLGGGCAIVSGREILGPGLPETELHHRADDLVQAAAAAATVAIDELTSALLRGRFDTGADGRELRGGLGEPDRTRLLSGTPLACIGRDQELDQLERIFDQCADERVATMVLLSGWDGVGKSRLGDEFLRRLEAYGQPITIWIGEADALHAGTAFGLLGKVLRHALRLHDDDELEVRRDKIRAWAARRMPGDAGARFAESLGDVVDTPFERDGRRDPRHDQRLPSEQIRQAFLSLLRAECAAQPVVIVLEDLHWGDLPTIKLIYAALDALSDQPLLVLALARNKVHELFPQLWADRCVQEIRLRKLSRRASTQLVRQVIGDEVGDDVIKSLVERSDRHAAYLEELSRAVAQGGPIRTPQIVLAMVQARIEKLDPAARRVLRAASIFGEVFWRGGVEGLLHDSDTAAWLAVLVEHGVIEVRDDTRFAGEIEYAFQHALVQEVAYEMLTDVDRVAGHWLAAQWLERVGEADAARIQHHYERCGSGGGPASPP